MDNSEKRRGTGAVLKELAVEFAVGAVIACALLCFIRPTVVRQSSMENTLKDGDYLILSRQAYRNHEPERGDIVVFKSNSYNESVGEDRNLIKRVIGLPGDVISIKDDQLYLNGKAYHEDYIKDGITPAIDVPEEGESFIVPEESYFCMGDNRVVSIDSRSMDVGCVPKEALEGRIVCRVFPTPATFQRGETQRSTTQG